ncbi:MAG: hypothetical protein HY078_14070 [Elusimicrobia bacterium]|nr:hypothetical protein [Elusimicrobiota bacterium]
MLSLGSGLLSLGSAIGPSARLSAGVELPRTISLPAGVGHGPQSGRSGPVVALALAARSGALLPALEALALPLPDYGRMDAFSIKNKADSDFKDRTGESSFLTRLLTGWRPPSGPRTAQASASAEDARLPESRETARLLVAPPSGGTISADAHENAIDSKPAGFAQRYAALQEDMLKDLEAAGLPRDLLAAYGAVPAGTYHRLNLATIRLPALQKNALSAVLRNRGFTVYEDAPWARVQEPSSAAEFVAASGLDHVHAAARRGFGEPPAAEGAVAGAAESVLRVFGAAMPRVDLAVLDSARASAALAVREFAPWAGAPLAFPPSEGASAALDDVLRSLAAAGRSKPAILLNPWRPADPAHEELYSRAAAALGGGAVLSSSPRHAGTLLMLAQIFGVASPGREMDILARLLAEAGDAPGAARAAFERALDAGLAPVEPGGLARWVTQLLGRTGA